MTSDERVHRALAGRSRVRTLEALRTHADPMSVCELTDEVGLHPNTVRFHLQQLISAGLATQQTQPRAERGRPRKVYSATSAAHESSNESGIYRAMAEALATQLEQSTRDPALAATAAGRAWGRDLARHRQPPVGGDTASRDVLTAVLDELGFDPHPRGDSGTDGADQDIELHHCPLLDVARAHPAVTCGVHLGLMQGVLLQTGDHVAATELHPFASPGVCVARLDHRPSAVRRHADPTQGQSPSPETGI